MFDVASQANGHLAEARKLKSSNGNKKLIYATLPIVTSSIFLEELRKVDFDPFSSELQRPFLQVKLQCGFLGAVYFGRY